MIVVGIGASAGGIEALRLLLSNLSPDTGAAFVVVQHLSPDFKSIMEDLLQKYTTMPIRQIEKDTLVEANHIYLMPSNKTITYFRGMLKLHDRKKEIKLSLPIDDFFHSLGSELKHEAIGVILSGSGTDGSRGARTIKEEEGIVLVQSPQSSGFDGMPKALIDLDIADGVFSPEELAFRIKDVIKLVRKFKSDKQDFENKIGAQSTGDEESLSFHKEWLEKIIQLAANRSNIPFEGYKIATLQRRSEKQMALNKCDNLKEYYHFLKKNEPQIQVLFRDFLISVTRFFRDQEFFDAVKERVIPKLFEKLKEDEICRIWIVACSTGEEAYTIGMLVMEYLQENNIQRDFKIFASDVNKKSIQIATDGIYNSSISADVPLYLLETYFKQEGKLYRVKSHLREKIIFAIHDVISDPPFINMNLISCRNFLIYLKSDTKVKILKTFYFSLRKNQHLILGPSEGLGEYSNVFIQPDRKHKIYQKEDMEYVGSRGSFRPSLELWNPTPLNTRKFFDQPSPEIPVFEETIDDPFSPLLIEEYVPRVIFLNKELDVLYMKGNFEAIFSLPQNVVKMNLERMLPHEGVLFFRDAVRVALDADDLIVYEQVTFNKKGNTTSAKVKFEKVNFPEIKAPLVKAEINFVEAVKDSQEKVKIFNLGDKEYNEERVLRLEKELDEKRVKIKTIKAELETINEELNTSNQELIASNEELQSTNEELQSVNEELHTVNAELQHKNKSLQDANNDTNNLLKTLDIGTIFLDKDLRIRRFTKAIKREFDLTGADINRPITSFSNRLLDVDLEKACHQVVKTKKMLEQEVGNKDNQRFLLRIHPYLLDEKGNERVDGVVISLIDIEDILELKDSLEEAGHRFNTLMDVINFPVLFVDVKAKIFRAGKPLEGMSPEELITKSIYDILSKGSKKEMKKYLDIAAESNQEQVVNVLIESNKEVSKYTIRIAPFADHHNPETISFFLLGVIKAEV